MIYFTKDSLNFLKQLKKNNNREWFNENKQRYIDDVKVPFETFINDLIEEMQPHCHDLSITAKDAIFRIYRDVRFSKDKSPYKTKISAIVSPGGRKDKTIPGIYIEINDTEIRLYSGLYSLDTKQLSNLRTYLSHNMQAFSELINDPQFKQLFGEIKGEKNKRLSKDFEEDALHQPLLYNKQFYFFTNKPAKDILKENLINSVVNMYLIARPVSEFLHEGLY